MKNGNVDMLNGSIVKGLLSMTLPIMVMNVMQSLFNIIDMTVLRHFSTESAVGSVGASGVLITLCTSLLIGIAAGANVVVARRIGLGDRELVNHSVSTALIFAVVGGIVLSVFGAVFARELLKMTNCPPSLLEGAATYFRIYFYGLPLMMLYNFCAAILRAMGDTRRPMKFMILGGIVKVVFTLISTALLGMGVEGVAIATIISNLVICILAFGAVMKNDSVHIDLRKPGFYMSELKQMLFIGIPSGLQTGMYSLANVIITTAVNSFGADATTGISIANQFDGLLYQIIYAPSLGTIPYVAQNLGAGNIKRVKKSVLYSILITTILGLTFGLSSSLFSEQLSSLMSSSPQVIAYSRQKMCLISATYFLSGINEIMSGVLKGMGRPIIPAISTMVYMCLLRFVWVYSIFPMYRNLTFLYLVWPIGWTLSIVTLLLVYFPTIAKKEKELSLLRD